MDTKQTPKQIEDYWQDKAIANTAENLTLARGWGGAYYSVTGMKPYLPKEGRMTIDGWNFVCTYWQSNYCGKRAYISYWKSGIRSREKMYIAKDFNFFNDVMHYTYWLYGSSQTTEEFANALKKFLDEIWIK